MINAWRVNRDLTVLLGIVCVTGIINFFAVNQRAFLNFYYLPVIMGSYLLGRRKGVYSALLSCTFVYVIAFFGKKHFGGPDVVAWGRWLDLCTWGCFLILTAYVTGTLYEVKEAQLGQIRQAYAGVIEIMAKFIDSVDRYTENHSARVARCSVTLARALGLNEAEVVDIRIGAYLHDIGKVDVSTDLLRKAARLSPEEYAKMQQHVERGVEMVRSVGGILRHVIPMIAYHHERFDGTGLNGLVGENIPIGARIIAVADTYDAIISDRAYRTGRSHDEALAVIQAESGKQFDPRIVKVFLISFAEGPSADQSAEAA